MAHPVLKWPPQSLDLTLIELLWDVVELEIHIIDVQMTNCVMLTWTKNPCQTFPATCWICETNNLGNSEGKVQSRPKISNLCVTSCDNFSSFNSDYSSTPAAFSIVNLNPQLWVITKSCWKKTPSFIIRSSNQPLAPSITESQSPFASWMEEYFFNF